MWIEEQLRKIIAQAAHDFDQVIAQDRKIASSEDGTVRGDHLDQVLADQKNEREELWAKLHELEDAYTTQGLRRLYLAKEDKQTKHLATLKAEKEGLIKEVNQQMKESRIVPRQHNETINELQFKEKLSTTVEQLGEALKSVDQELSDTSDALDRERIVLTECQKITNALQQRLDEVQQPEAMQQATLEAHEKLNQLKAKHKAVMDELVEFLNEFYPPHPVDIIPGVNDTEAEVDTCELIFILEDLMNLTVLKPHDPYLKLEKGTYWSPYIETIIKAGVAVRDPKDSYKIRLVDFHV
ncbi:centromere protein Cenp-K [Phascolomyces articulosus]|uniref:Centromere protein Cenp-K n=1 Tax=Phascolomyces articulosus TaxID=60185 RepID=A0AAD5K943_9FUNG|nr:centromere protein Cenp-K [Phascolomyces articulosus]